MRILRLYIQECGVFRQTLIDFTRDGKPQDVLCLAGVNGSGKTTVMELLFNLPILLNPNLSLQDIHFDRLKSNVLTRVKFSQLDIDIDGNILSLVIGDTDNIQKTNLSNQVFIIEPELGLLISRFENSIVKTPEDDGEKSLVKRLKAVIEHKDLSERRIEKIDIEKIQPLISQIKESVDSDNGLENKYDNLPFIYFFNAHDREIHDIRYRSLMEEKPKYQLIHRYSPKNDDLKKTLIYYDYAYQDKFEDLKNWVNANILIGKSINKIDRPNFNVVIKTDNGSLHGLELLSSGEESLLIIAIQIYLRAHKNSVFIIDEIDQSLHPEFQERIIKLIYQLQADKGCQIIVSSHSDFIWKIFDSQGLIDLTGTVF
jgi:ABC-type lipoprotein export system ATPase subunit